MWRVLWLLLGDKLGNRADLDWEDLEAQFGAGCAEVNNNTWNTPTGTDQTVDLGDGACVTLANVTSPGETDMSTSSSDPGATAGGFQIAGQTYYDITTTATYDGTITVALPYDPTGMSAAQQAALRLLHDDNGTWTDVTTSVDTVQHIVYGTVAHLSRFAIGIDTSPPTTTISGADSLWHKAAVSLTLIATDNGGSGVAATYYKVDGGVRTEGTSLTVPAPADHSNDGVHPVLFYSTDKAGNTEATQSVTVKIDTTSPVISVAYLSVSHRHHHSGGTTHGSSVARGHLPSWQGWSRYGTQLSLSYRIDDNLSPTVAVTIELVGFRGRILQTISLGQRPTGVLLTYRLPSKLPHGVSRLRVSATDLASNTQSKLAGAKITVK